MKSDTQRGGPLAGLKIVDLTSVISGPGAMGILCDQGADVIKVEPAAGDIMRSRGKRPGQTPGFVSCNRGKRSIVLNLKEERAKEVLWRLIARADVLAQNFRPGVIERLGFDADTVLARHPRLIYLSISGVGENGPYANKRVYDPVVQALSGMAEIQADPATGRPKMIRTLVADKTTAIYAAQAVMAALYSRERTGQGQHVRVSMLDTMISYLWPEGMAQHSLLGDEDDVQPTAAHDMIFPTADGYVTIGAVSNAEWRALCTAIERPDLIDDPRFATPGARNTNRQERLETVEAALSGLASDTLLDRLEAADVPCAPVLSRRQMLDDAQVAHNQLVHTLEQPGLGTLRQARAAARFSRTPIAPVTPAPALGEHGADILRELGYDEASIRSLSDAPR